MLVKLFKVLFFKLFNIALTDLVNLFVPLISFAIKLSLSAVEMRFVNPKIKFVREYKNKKGIISSMSNNF